MKTMNVWTDLSILVITRILIGLGFFSLSSVHEETMVEYKRHGPPIHDLPLGIPPEPKMEEETEDDDTVVIEDRPKYPVTATKTFGKGYLDGDTFCVVDENGVVWEFDREDRTPNTITSLVKCFEDDLTVTLKGILINVDRIVFAATDGKDPVFGETSWIRKDE